MGYIEQQLRPGEQILFQIKHGHQWYHYLPIFIGQFVIAPLIAYGAFVFLINLLGQAPTPGPQDPMLLQILIPLGVKALIFGVPLLVVVSGLREFISFFMNEVALTNRRILGRTCGAWFWMTVKIDLPLSGIGKVQVWSEYLQIFSTGGDCLATLRFLSQRKEFVEAFTRLPAH